MPAHESPARPEPASLRERRRSTAVREILDAAEEYLAEHGPHALSLRAIARGLGMTVQALYHYFPSRDALVTALITNAYDDLADAVEAAVHTGVSEADGTPLPGALAAAEGYRRWAIDNPERFQLLYGTPLRYYEAPEDGPTTQAVRRMAATFQRELFAGYTTAQLTGADLPPLSPALRAHLDQMPADTPERALPPAATTLFLIAWGQLHGLVILEVFGHTDFLGDHQAEIFRTAIRNVLREVHARIPAP
ncbi:TetR/AcrR family transcriptional regulator [Streptomyces geranii]|uniref:TetR/AcrR family transcriptional regulator n=1 Tax=Streptomyces geranii TaxID=2058923 RepID=UPI000D02F06E|nr:TetR/AcrR family transcriptional regulator [Streptomyces geranii]